MRVGEALTAYKETLLARQRRGSSTYRTLVLLFEPAAGDDLAAISQRHVADLIGLMTAHAPVHGQRAQAYAAPFFDWAIGERLVGANPMVGLRSPKPLPTRERLLSVDEMRRIWLSAGSLAYPFGPAIQLMVLTGAYREDVGSMQISELTRDPTSGRAWRPTARSLGEGGLEIPLSTKASEVIDGCLRHRMQGCGFIFSTTGRTPISGWSKAKRRLDLALAARSSENSPMAPWRLNDFRSSFAAIARDVLGTDHVVVERCLGRISAITNPLAKEWMSSEAIRDEHRAALDRWAALLAED